MPRPQRGREVSEAARARAAELWREGVTQHRIVAILRAEGLAETSQPTIARILAAAKQSPAAARSPRSRAPAPARPPVAPGPPSAGAAGDEPIDPVAELEERLREIRAFITQVRIEGKIPAYKDLVKLEADIASRLQSMRPPTPPDPALDPSHREAREKLRDDLNAFLVTARELAGGAP